MMKKMRNLCAALLVLFLSAIAQANFTNFRYGLGTGSMLELGFGKFGLGVATMGLSASGTDYNVNVSLLGGRLSFYFNKFAKSSVYLSADYGQVKADASQTSASSGVVFTGQSTSTYSGGAVGYHWFWKWFNLNLGLGFRSFSFGDIALKSSSGASSPISGFSISAPILDLGFGVSFF
ncbi:MAG: hypothetical protein WCH11_06330 [Bdellovibrio sp.]